MEEHIKQLYSEVAEAVTHMTSMLESIERGSYGRDEAVFDLDNLNLGPITLLLNAIVEGGDGK